MPDDMGHRTDAERLAELARQTEDPQMVDLIERSARTIERIHVASLSYSNGLKEGRTAGALAIIQTAVEPLLVAGNLAAAEAALQPDHPWFQVRAEVRGMLDRQKAQLEQSREA